MFEQNDDMIELSLEEMKQVSGGTTGHSRCQDLPPDVCDEMNNH
jgi:bacteriocin-like protein